MSKWVYTVKNAAGKVVAEVHVGALSLKPYEDAKKIAADVTGLPASSLSVRMGRSKNPRGRKVAAKPRRKKNPGGWYIHIQKHGRGPVQVWNGKSFSNRPDRKPVPFTTSNSAMYKARWLLGKYHRMMSPYKIWVSDMLYGQPTVDTRVNPSRRENLEVAARKLEDFSGHKARRTVRIAARSKQQTGLVFGEVDLIGYTATRDGKTERYGHTFKKSSRPLLAVTSDGKQLHIVGGRYEFTEAGIEDR